MEPNESVENTKSASEIIASIVDIYDRFSIPPNLRMHMFRVAGVGTLICNAWKGPPIDREDIVAVLLLHDLGNIVKFDFSSAKGINFLPGEEKQRINFWRGVKSWVKKKYGTTDHVATINMVKELQIESKLMHLVEEMANAEDLEFDLATSENWNLKILVYSDVRVGPFGVISMQDRFKDLLERYTAPRVEIFRRLFSVCLEVENQLIPNLQIKPEEINDGAVNPLISKFVK